MSGGPLHVRLGAVAGAVAAIQGEPDQGSRGRFEIDSTGDGEVVGPDLLETQLMPPGDPPLGAETGGVESVDHLQAPAPEPNPARSLDPGFVPQGGDHRGFRLRAHGAVEVEGMVEAGEQADGDVEVAGTDVQGLAEGALDEQLLNDHLASFLDLLLELAELLVLQLQGAPGSPVLELHFRFQLQVGQQLRLELQCQPGDVDQGAAVGSRTLGQALLIGSVVEAPVVDLSVAAQPHRRLPRGRKHRQQEKKTGGGGAPGSH